MSATRKFRRHVTKGSKPMRAIHLTKQQFDEVFYPSLPT